MGLFSRRDADAPPAGGCASSRGGGLGRAVSSAFARARSGAAAAETSADSVVTDEERGDEGAASGARR